MHTLTPKLNSGDVPLVGPPGPPRSISPPMVNTHAILARVRGAQHGPMAPARRDLAAADLDGYAGRARRLFQSARARFHRSAARGASRFGLARHASSRRPRRDG